MTKVVSDMSMSLDGFVTGPGDSRENPFGKGAETLHDWLWKNPTPRTKEILQNALDSCGAVIMGRTSFDKNEGDGGWGDGGPLGDTPVFVVTHHAPTRQYPPVFRFVTDGVASAIEQAKASIPQDRNIGLHGATMPQQALALGLLDEIHVHVVPLLIGGGTRLFDLFDGPIHLDPINAETTPGATHLSYRVVR
jgi:dihydrofolate reductase